MWTRDFHFTTYYLYQLLDFVIMKAKRKREQFKFIQKKRAKKNFIWHNVQINNHLKSAICIVNLVAVVQITMLIAWMGIQLATAPHKFSFCFCFLCFFFFWAHHCFLNFFFCCVFIVFRPIFFSLVFIILA